MRKGPGLTPTERDGEAHLLHWDCTGQRAGPQQGGLISHRPTLHLHGCTRGQPRAQGAPGSTSRQKRTPPDAQLQTGGQHPPCRLLTIAPQVSTPSMMQAARAGCESLMKPYSPHASFCCRCFFSVGSSNPGPPHQGDYVPRGCWANPGESVVVPLGGSWHQVGGAESATHPPQCPGWTPRARPGQCPQCQGRPAHRVCV